MTEQDIRSTAEQLGGSPLFKGVDLADREALIRTMQRRSYKQGTVLFEKGDAGDSMFIILAGQVRIYTRDEQGNEFTLRYLNQTYGEFAMLDQQPRSASASAAEDLEVLVLHRDDFLAFLRERPLVGLSMMRNLVERVRYTTLYLQKVMNATQQLLRGEYDQAVQGVSQAGTDAEIQTMIQTFLQMVRNVQAREFRLQQAAGAQQAPSGQADP
jgi:CRP-like cAMP-binding protein